MKKSKYIRGAYTHRRTETDYLATMLDAVTLDDWREVVAATLAAAKNGDAQARSWLASYVMGRPGYEAARPVTVVVQQLAGRDAVAEQLARPHIERAKFPMLHDDDDVKEAVTDAVAAELRRLDAKG
ncbi:MAG: hypothetical protein JSR65_06605 [Proteobacteria bacterium]|nr:hypothetical protein [Pseudomonadota bacterium]